jgi:hypothetical protein
MPDVFLSHVEQDAEVAAELRTALTAAGHSVGDDIDTCAVVIVLASVDAEASAQVRDEILRAHDRGTPLVPVLIGTTHVELTGRQPEWRAAFGASTSIEVPPEGVAAIVPRVLQGVAVLTAPRPRAAHPRGSHRGWKGWQLMLAAAMVVVVVTVVVVALAIGGGGSRQTSGDGGEQPTAQPSTSFTPGPLADSATTPLQTVIGGLRITKAVLTAQVCSRDFAEGCRTTAGDDRFVVLTLADWNGGDVTPSTEMLLDMGRSYVVAGERRAVFRDEVQEDPSSGTFRIIYAPLPAGVASEDVRLAWPGSSTLLLHLVAG